MWYFITQSFKFYTRSIDSAQLNPIKLNFGCADHVQIALDINYMQKGMTNHLIAYDSTILQRQTVLCILCSTKFIALMEHPAVLGVK